MPSLYAHNKFGKLVLAQLPDEEKAVIEKYPRAFRIGLQGPDYLFFYRAFHKNKMNQIGITCHHQDAYKLFQNALEVIEEFGKDSIQYSYLLGMICHLGLDSICHPYVYEAMELTGCGHCEIEGDFDRLLMSKDGHIPEKYRFDKLVPTDFDTALGIVYFYDGVSTHQVQSSLRWMKFIKRILFSPNIVKRSILEFAMRLTPHYKKYKGHIIRPKENPACCRESEHLYKLLKSAIAPTVQMISGFNQALKGFPLPDDFHIDFTGKKYI